MLLADNAVLSGPFGPAMALIAERPAVIHMFGAPMVDATLFERFPITHLLMDRDNAGKAWIEYPEIMNKSRHVCTYHIGPADVSLFRIAGHTSNATANAYRPSLLEQAIEFRSRGDYPGATELAERFVLDHPENITANLLLGELADAVGDLARAERFVQSALRFSPTNHHLNAVMAGFYKDRYQATGDEKYKIEAVTYFGEALRLSSRPVNQDNMRTELQKLGADPDGD
jgi:tetratricopeptide (TPR) repeat protein